MPDAASMRRVPLLVLAVVVSGVIALAASACTDTAAIERDAAGLTGGDPQRGKGAIHTYGCDTCHTIPGVRTAHGLVGPPLTQIARRAYLAGRLPNTPENIQQWIQHPQQIDPQTVMPEMNVTDSDARDIAAYLYTLR